MAFNTSICTHIPALSWYMKLCIVYGKGRHFNMHYCTYIYMSIVCTYTRTCTYSYAPWCPACKQFTDTWESFADWAIERGMKVGKVDVTVETSKTIV